VKTCNGSLPPHPTSLRAGCFIVLDFGPTREGVIGRPAQDGHIVNSCDGRTRGATRPFDRHPGAIETVRHAHGAGGCILTNIFGSSNIGQDPNLTEC
jgi:hypothetical protein